MNDTAECSYEAEFDPNRLAYLQPYLEMCLRRGILPGGSLLIYRHGQLCYRKHFGYADLKRKKPFHDDTILRMYSMTKPVTTTAAMILLERGEIQMSDKVSTYLPAFADVKVISCDSRGLQTVVPAKREIEIHDLFTMTSGITGRYTTSVSGRELIRLFEEKKGTTMELLDQIAKIPLEFSPGDNWLYGRSLDTLAGVIEVVSGLRFSDFLKKNIFEPLNMKDAAFFVPEEKRERFAVLYESDGKGGFRESDVNYNGLYDSPPAYEEAGSSLCCTEAEYVSFAEMLRNGGKAGSANIPGKKSIAFMHENHLADVPLATMQRFNPGYGYGCGLRTLLDPVKAGILASPGEFGWSGAGGTWFSIDPAEDMVILFAAQVHGLRLGTFLPGIINIIYGALKN